MPSLDELDDGDSANEAQQQPPYENHSVIMEVREETAEESRRERERKTRELRSRNAKDHDGEDGSKERRNKHKVKKRHSFVGVTNSSSNSEIGAIVDPSPLGADSGKDDYNLRKSGKPNAAAVMTKDKFKSMGSLQMEPSLPRAPISSGDDSLHSSPPSSTTSSSFSSSQPQNREQLLAKAHRMVKSMRSLLAREKTLNITPKKNGGVSLIGARGSWGMSRSMMLRDSDDAASENLTLLSHTSFPGMPTYPVLAASHSSPWNC